MSVSITARLKTWHPATQTQRTLKTAHCPFSVEVRPLVAFASTMLPRFTPQNVKLLYGITTPTLLVCFGTDRKGTQWSVDFEVPAKDVLTVFNRMMCESNAEAVGVATVPIESDGDGGETLTVPAVSASALAEMTAVSAAIN